MGYLTGGTFGGSTSKIIISTWVRISQASLDAATANPQGCQPIITWGDPTDLTGDPTGFSDKFSYAMIGQPAPWLGFRLCGVANSATISCHSTTLTPPGGTGPPYDFSWTATPMLTSNSVAGYDPITFPYGLRFTGTPFVADSWNHVCMAADVSGETLCTNSVGDTAFTLVSANPMTCAINASNCSPNLVSMASHAGFGGAFADNIRFLVGASDPGATAIAGGNYASTVLQTDIPYGSLTTAPGFTNDLVFGGDISLVPANASGLTGAGSFFTVSGWEIDAAQIFGLPCQPALAASLNEQVEFADTQIWLGKYIDFSDPAAIALFAKRKTIGGQSRIVPQSPSVAAAQLGRPDYLFQRSKNAGQHFEKNQGTGSAVTKVGGMTDYTPGPGQ